MRRFAVFDRDNEFRGAPCSGHLPDTIALTEKDGVIDSPADPMRILSSPQRNWGTAADRDPQARRLAD